MRMQAQVFIAPISNLHETPTIISFVLALLLLGAGMAVALVLFKRLLPRIYVGCAELALFLSWLFGLDFLVAIIALFLGLGVTFFLIANMNENRELTGNNMLVRGLKSHKRKHRPEALFDRDALYKKIETAVITLSRQKVGALITFEKRDPLTDVMKSGTLIDAPVSAELLQTIFYPGTRLHDGAVIIRNDKIAAASVYFTPTTRPLTGKYGSRHRAAIGITEVCDAVTIVVSEETGRISIAYEGELQPVGPDTFLRTFDSYMSLVKDNKEKE